MCAPATVRPASEYTVCALRHFAPLQRLPHRVHHRRHPLPLAHDRLHTHLPQRHRRRVRHPARHHDHLGVELAARLEQPLDHLRRVQIRQAVVQHDQRRLHPPDLQQRVHPRRRLHHLHVQVGPLDRQHQRLQVAGIVVHHHHHLVPVPLLQLGRHRHLVRPQERREIVGLHPPPPGGRAMALQQPLVDPVRHCRRGDLTHTRDTLGPPIPLMAQTHRTPNTTKTESAQGVLWPRCNSSVGNAKLKNYSWLECRPGNTQRRASVHLLVASNTASTALRSVLSRISHVPVSSCASRPPSPCTATSTNLRSNASMIVAPSSAIELSGKSSSKQSDAARAAASTRFRVVSVPCSSASASRPSKESFTRTITRCGRSEGRTSSPWKITTRRLARDRTASSCSCSIGRTSAVCATLILRWSIFMPSWAISADSMFRTTCLACTSLVVSTWISLTSPSGVTTTRADRMPVSPVIRFSARFTPQGSGTWLPPDAPGVSGAMSRTAPAVSCGFEVVTSVALPSLRGFCLRPWRCTARGQPPPVRLPIRAPAPARTPLRRC